MSARTSRRRFLQQAGTIAVSATLPQSLWAGEKVERARVVIGRDEKLRAGSEAEQRPRLERLLDASMQKLTKLEDVSGAWRYLFRPGRKVGIKVNALGLSTNPAVVDALVAGLRKAEIPAEDILIWDRFDVELAQAGFRLNKSGKGVQCRGTDADNIGRGYEQEIQVSGKIGSCYSQIVAREVDVLISVCVLKDHNLAGVSLGMKNFYGAIHNPNKYHDHHCDPYIADVVGHKYIRPRWKLTVVDGTRAQYHAGPGRHPGFAWDFGGLIVSRDFVAADAVAADVIDMQRVENGMARLADDGRPASHIRTAGQRGLGVAELERIERIEV